MGVPTDRQRDCKKLSSYKGKSVPADRLKINEWQKKRCSHRKIGRQEKMSKREKAIPLTGIETAQTEFLGRKMHSHRLAGNKWAPKERRSNRQTDKQEKISKWEWVFPLTGWETAKLSSYKGKSVHTDRLEIIEWQKKRRSHRKMDRQEKWAKEERQADKQRDCKNCIPSK